MKQNMFLLLALGIFLPALSAQVKVSEDFSYKVSKPYMVVDGAKHYFFEKGKVHKITEQKDGYLLQILDPEEPKWEKTKGVGHGLPKKTFSDYVYKTGDKYYLIYNERDWDGQRGKNTFFFQEVDMNQMTITKERKKLVVADELVRSSGGFFRWWGGLGGGTIQQSYRVSGDSSNFLIQYRKKPEKKRDVKNQDVIGLYVFDKSMNKIWGGERRMPYTEAQMDNVDYAVDGQGNAYILARVSPENSADRTDEKGRPNYHFELLKYTPDATRPQKSKVDVGEKFVNQARIFESNKGQMVIAGYTARKSYSDGADGIFYSQVGKDGMVREVVLHDIPVEVLNQFEKKRVQKKNERKSKKNKAEFAFMDLSKIVFYDDGGVVLIGEKYFIDENTTTDARGNTTTTYTTHYHDILVSKIGPNGTLAWMKKLPKRQQGKGIGKDGMSYKHFFTNGKHYFTYLDNVNNMDLGMNERPKFHVDGFGGFFTAYRIEDGTGEVEKLSIFDMRNVEFANKKKGEVFQFFTDRIIPTADNKFAIELYKKKKEDVLISVEIGQ